MATPRPAARGPWTEADHADNARRIQRDADRKAWERLGEAVGFRGGELMGLLTRFFDDRLSDALRTQQTLTIETLTDPDQADAWRVPVVDLIIDDLTELVTLLTKKEKKHDPRTKKPRGSGEESGRCPTGGE